MRYSKKPETIIGYEVFHCILGEEFFELGIQVGRQGFIVCQDQRRLVQLLDHGGHGEGLT